MITFSVDYAAIARWFPIILLLFLRLVSTNILFIFLSIFVNVGVCIYEYFWGSHDVILVVAAISFLGLLTSIRFFFALPGLRFGTFIIMIAYFGATAALFHKAGMF